MRPGPGRSAAGRRGLRCPETSSVFEMKRGAELQVWSFSPEPVEKGRCYRLGGAYTWLCFNRKHWHLEGNELCIPAKDCTETWNQPRAAVWMKLDPAEVC